MYYVSVIDWTTAARKVFNSSSRHPYFIYCQLYFKFPEWSLQTIKIRMKLLFLPTVHVFCHVLAFFHSSTENTVYTMCCVSLTVQNTWIWGIPSVAKHPWHSNTVHIWHYNAGLKIPPALEQVFTPGKVWHCIHTGRDIFSLVWRTF